MSRRSEIYAVLYDVDRSPLAKTDFYTNDSPRISCNFQPLSLHRTSRIIPAKRFILGTFCI